MRTHMRDRALCSTLVLLACVSGVRVAAAEEVTAATIEWPPYSGESLPGHGFALEIADSALARADREARFVFMPWKRARQRTAAGQIAALTPAYHSEEREQLYHVSSPYASSPVVLCALRESKIAYRALTDLEPYLVGVVMGYVNSPEFDRAEFITRDLAPSDLHNLRKLLAGRVDLIAIDRNVALHLLATEPTLAGRRAQIEFLDPPLAQLDIHFMVSRQLPQGEQLVAAFDRALEAVRKEGTVSRIMARHGLREGSSD